MSYLQCLGHIPHASPKFSLSPIWLKGSLKGWLILNSTLKLWPFHSPSSPCYSSLHPNAMHAFICSSSDSLEFQFGWSNHPALPETFSVLALKVPGPRNTLFFLSKLLWRFTSFSKGLNLLHIHSFNRILHLTEHHCPSPPPNTHTHTEYRNILRMRAKALPHWGLA